MIPFWILGVFILISGLVTLQWGGVYILVGMLTFAGGAVTILLYMMFAPKFPVTAYIFQKRQGSMRIIRDKVARLETDKGSGTYKYKFKKQKDECPAALYDNLYPHGAKEIALFYSPAPGEYYQAIFNQELKKTGTQIIKYLDEFGKEQTKEVDILKASIEPVPDNILEWTFNKATRQKQKYMTVSAWDKYWPLIMFAVIGVVIMIMVSGLFNSMKPVTESNLEASQNFAAASNTIAAALEKFSEAQGGTQEVPAGTPPAPPDL